MAAPRVYDWNQSDDPTGNNLARNVPGWTVIWDGISVNSSNDASALTLTASNQLSIPNLTFERGLMHDANSIDPWVEFTLDDGTASVGCPVVLRAHGWESGVHVYRTGSQIAVALKINGAARGSAIRTSSSGTHTTGSIYRARVTGTSTSTAITIQKWNGSAWASITTTAGSPANFDSVNLGVTTGQAPYLDKNCGVYISSRDASTTSLYNRIVIEPQPTNLIKVGLAINGLKFNRHVIAFDADSSAGATVTWSWSSEGTVTGPLEVCFEKLDGTVVTAWGAPLAQDGTSFTAFAPKGGWLRMGVRDSTNTATVAWTVLRFGPGEVIADDGQSLRAAFGGTTGATGTSHDRAVAFMATVGSAPSYTMTEPRIGVTRNLADIIRGNMICGADADLLVAFANSATGSTTMSAHATGQEWTKTTNLLTAFGWKLTRFVFEQGQSDGSLAAASTYVTDFTTMANAIRTAASRTAEQLPIYVVLLGRYDTNFTGATGTDAGWSNVREAQLRVCGEWPGVSGLTNVKLLWEEMTFEHADGLHLTTSSTTNGYHRAAEVEARALMADMGISTWRPRVRPSSLTQIASDQYALSFDKSDLPNGTTLSLHNAQALIGYQLLDGTDTVIVGTTVAWDAATERVIFTLPASPPAGPYKARSFWGRDPFAGTTYANTNWVQADVEANTGSGYKVPAGATRSTVAVSTSASGSASVDLAPLTTVGGGAALIAGALGTLLDPVTTQSAAALALAAAASGLLDPLTAIAPASLSIAGLVTTALTPLSAEASATLPALGPSGTTSATLLPLSTESSGAVAVAALFGAPLAPLVAASVGALASTGLVTTSLAPLAGSAAGFSFVAGSQIVSTRLTGALRPRSLRGKV